MLVSLPRTTVALVGDVDPTVQNIVNLIPDYSVGRRVHALYVNYASGALPGNYSQMFGTGPSFRSVFFPSWQRDPLSDLIGDTGLDDGWWSRLSVALLCQAIADMGSQIRGQMVTGSIDADLAAFNDTLRQRSARVYARTFGATFEPFTALSAKLGPGGKQAFHDALLDNVQTRQIWYQAGMWISPAWEMFNQYAKYIALGASDVEVDTLIGELIAAGLPVPDAVNQAGWRTYAEAFRDKPSLDLEDIRTQCSGPITQTTYVPAGRTVASLPNGNCFEFTANGMPGSGYRQVPGGGSCFTAATQVLDGTGAPVPVTDLRRGDTVLTRDGTAVVGYVATPARGGRDLFRIDGAGAVFTGTHPFVNAASDPGDPAVLAQDPNGLLDAIPMLANGGIGPLAAGAEVLQRAPGPDGPVATVHVTSIDPVADADLDGYLYDVHLAPDGGRQEFWVGDGTTFHLACPEFPVLDSVGPSALAVVALMEGLLSSSGPEGQGWPADTATLLRDFGVGIYTDSAYQALSMVPSYGAPPPTGTVAERVEALYAGLGSAPPEVSALAAALFDTLLGAIGEWLPSLVSMGWRTTTLLGGDILSITIFDLAVRPGTFERDDQDVRIDVTATGSTRRESMPLWPQRSAEDTAFHVRVDRVIHADLSVDDGPVELDFAVVADSETVPRAIASAPLGTVEHGLHSALLHDASGQAVGNLRFDVRRIGRDAAAVELVDSGLWTDTTALAYAQALGTAMVAPVLQRLALHATPA